MDSALEARIRKWVEIQRNHPGRQPERETSWTWLDALLTEIDSLRKPPANG